MGFYTIDIDKLSEYTGISVKELKDKTYAELERMEKNMHQEKFLVQNKKNAEDEEYERLVLKYFEPVSILRNWFTDQEIVLACANCGITVRDICQETTVEPGKKCFYPDAEYLRTSVEAVVQYDKQGREYMERAHKKMDVYRIKNQYQSIRHGNVIIKLLFDRYPEMQEFEFKAYGMHCGESSYEIYPKNGIYTGLTYLMTGNIDAILDRNRRYCKWFNNGRYSSAECEKAFQEENALKMFDLIRRIGINERELGHSPVCMKDEKEFIDNMEMAGEYNGMKLFMEKPKYYSSFRKFMIDFGSEPISIETFLNGYLALINKNTGMSRLGTELHICKETDYLNNFGYTALVYPDNYDEQAIDNAKEGKADMFVTVCYGYIEGDRANLTVRIRK